MPAMLIGLKKIPRILFMAALCNTILDLNTNSNPNPRLELGLGSGLGLGLALGLGLPSWWNQSWVYTPL